MVDILGRVEGTSIRKSGLLFPKLNCIERRVVDLRTCYFVPEDYIQLRFKSIIPDIEMLLLQVDAVFSSGGTYKKSGDIASPINLR